MQIEKITEHELTAADETQISALLMRAFQEGFEDRSFYQQRHTLRVIARDAGQIVGHMALNYRAIRMGDKLVDNMGLAEVATDPAHQGKGIASRLLQETITIARASQADFYTLFGDRPLYAGHGFRSVSNCVTRVDMHGARTGEVQTAKTQALMVMELGDLKWDGAAPIDLLGFSF